MLLLGEQHTELQAQITTQLAAVETLFAEELRSDLPCVNKLAEHLEQYRGKMLRPSLLFLSALASNPRQPLEHRHVVLGTVVEMVHMATLVHDDVLDESDVRRKSSTVNILHGNETAVMLGDYLISHAYHLCSSLDSQRAARMVAAATNTVCEGELLQLSNRMNWALDEPTYFEIIKRKTAALCGISCRLGAVCSSASDEIFSALDDYGMQVGTAFQIIDDVLDLMGDPSIVGKSLGKDIEKGKLTLPLIHHLAQAEAGERNRLVSLLKQGNQNADEIGSILSRSDSVQYAKDVAVHLIDNAKRSLKPLPESPVVHCLCTIADAVVARQF